MRKRHWIGSVGLAGLVLCLAGCKDTKTLQENEQLKSQVAELQRENGELGNDVETLTAARDELTKENSVLQAKLNKRPAAKVESRKHRRGRKTQQS